MSMNMIRKLPTPKEIKELYPLSDKIVETKKQRDKEIADVFTGKSNKFLLIIGPCSADKEEPVLDYISRLVPVQEQVKDKILIIPRIYTNKPRTTGEGYKGMIHQPDPTKKEDMLEGLIKVRSLHTKAIEQTGFTCADEMLYPENYRYLSDLLSYVAIGARSVEDQQHRLTSSGMDIPVGMKNPTAGDMSVMLNSIRAAQAIHTSQRTPLRPCAQANSERTQSSKPQRSTASTTRIPQNSRTPLNSTEFHTSTRSKNASPSWIPPPFPSAWTTESRLLYST